MKKNSIAIIIGALSLVIVVASVIIYAWYVNVNKVGHIDAQTDGIVLTYKIDDEYNSSNKYNIDNLAFFDIDNASETKYFKEMATKIKINLENKGNDSVTASIASSNTPIKVYALDGITEESVAYAKVIFSTSSELTYSENESNTVLSEYITGNESISNIEIAPKGEATIYAYVFGVQEIDSASNEQFLNSEYSFDILISAN
ncbi:MAG: hypothetical protein E7176_00765 [Erysipelotrichaceae bacterium]|nr:hypothetical protein [Erysipelotrichaceae bacterium]